MKSEILVIAEAVLANIHVLEMLINKLPDADRAAVAQVVHATPAAIPMATTPAPAPVIPAVAPVVAAPAPVVPAPVVAAPANRPFTTQKELITYVMAKYKDLGPVKGQGIQGVMTSLGINNINEVKPELYQSFFDGVEAIK